MARINKKDIIDYVSEQAYLSKRDSRAALESIFEMISDALVAGSEVDIPNFGAFIVKERKEKEITHPVSKEKIKAPDRKTVSLRVSSSLKERLNGK